MKLRQFTAGTRFGQTRINTQIAPTLTITRHIGRIYFNSATVEILGLCEKDYIAFYQNEENATDWYFTKTSENTDTAFQLRIANAGGNALEISSSSLAKSIIRSNNKQSSCQFLLKPTTVKRRGMWKICIKTINQ